MSPDKDKIVKVMGAIKLRGIKKIHVAKRIGCSPQELTHFLKGRRKLREDCMTRLEAYLGV